MNDWKLLNLHGLARELRLPAAWLKDEAEHGRIPCLQIGRKLRFNTEAVRAALAERAAQTMAKKGACS